MPPLIKPIPQKLFPHKDSLAEAVDYIQAQLPIDDPNKLYALLMMYQNTVLHCQRELYQGNIPWA